MNLQLPAFFALSDFIIQLSFCYEIMKLICLISVVLLFVVGIDCQQVYNPHFPNIQKTKLSKEECLKGCTQKLNVCVEQTRSLWAKAKDDQSILQKVVDDCCVNGMFSFRACAAMTCGMARAGLVIGLNFL